jgi:hypothetical protein
MGAGHYTESLVMLLGDCAANTAASTSIVSSDNQLSGDMNSARLIPTGARQKVDFY